MDDFAERFSGCPLPEAQKRQIKNYSPGSIPLDIDIPQCNNAVVYVKIITNQAVPVYNVMAF